MITPVKLNKGDKVAVVAPARKVAMSEIVEGVEVLRSWGLQVVFSENLFNSDNQFSGSDAQRAEDFQKAINNPEIKAVFCARGGYGAVRIIDLIDFSSLADNPKWIVGFSDITVFHSKLHSLSIESIHAPVLTTFPSTSKDALESLRRLLMNNAETDTSNNEPVADVAVENGDTHNSHTILQNTLISNIPGNATGIIVGGNLSILYSLLGSNCDIDTTDKILFIEDLDEYLYHIDRMIMALKRAGKLHNIKGLVVGAFSDMKDNAVPFGKTAEEIIRDAVAEYGYPVCFNMPFGHISNNMPLILGRKVELNVEKHTVNLQFIDKNETLEKQSVTKRILKSAMWFAVFFLIIAAFGLIYKQIINSN